MNLLFLKEINSYHHNKGNAYYLTTHLITLPNRCSKTSQLQLYYLLLQKWEIPVNFQISGDSIVNNKKIVVNNHKAN